MKKILNSLLILIVLSVGVVNVNAKIQKKYDFSNMLTSAATESDPDDLIGFPYTVWNGEGEITLDDSITDYTMNYQWIALSTAQVSAIDTARDNYEEKVDIVRAELDSLYAKYEAKYQIYEDLVETGTATEQQLEEARSAAQTEYNTYKNYYDTSMIELDGLLDDYYETIPDYTNNWTKATGLQFKGDFSGFSDERSFVLWVKVDYSNKSIYDYAILTVNGTLEEDEDDIDYQSYWEKFVEKFKTVKSMEGLFDLSDNDAYTVTNTDSELKIVYTGYDKSTVTTIFRHENGIVKYVPNDAKDAILIDSFLITHAITALAEMKGYTLDEFLAWVEAQDGDGLTLATHGIEFTTEPYTYTESGNGSSTTVETVKFTKFMMDIANGVKYEKVDTDNKVDADPDVEAPKDDTVESPKTGIVTYSIVILSGALLAGGTYYYLRKKNLLKKI